MQLSRELEFYIEQNSQEEPEVLRLLKRETYQKTTQPHMLSGYLQGRLLSMVSKISAPDFVLEIGTFTGYSTLCLAEGLSRAGKIVTIDKNPETAYIAKKYFNLSEFKDKITYIENNAINSIPELPNNIDLVFLDADKENYLTYLRLVKPKMKSGGIILADNILWKGKVIDESPDKKTQIIKDFNKEVKEDTDLEVVILPVRDGISIIRKK